MQLHALQWPYSSSSLSKVALFILSLSNDTIAGDFTQNDQNLSLRKVTPGGVITQTKYESMTLLRLI